LPYYGLETIYYSTAFLYSYENLISITGVCHWIGAMAKKSASWIARLTASSQVHGPTPVSSFTRSHYGNSWCILINASVTF